MLNQATSAFEHAAIAPLILLNGGGAVAFMTLLGASVRPKGEVLCLDRMGRGRSTHMSDRSGTRGSCRELRLGVTTGLLEETSHRASATAPSSSALRRPLPRSLSGRGLRAAPSHATERRRASARSGLAARCASPACYRWVPTNTWPLASTATHSRTDGQAMFWSSM
jgi:hypothetical protein